MLTTEQVKKIAEYMGYTNKDLAMMECGPSGSTWHPSENDEDNHIVFKALVDECKHQKIIFIDSVKGKKLEFGPLYIETANGELNENICLAFLSKMESK